MMCDGIEIYEIYSCVIWFTGLYQVYHGNSCFKLENGETLDLYHGKITHRLGNPIGHTWIFQQVGFVECSPKFILYEYDMRMILYNLHIQPQQETGIC